MLIAKDWKDYELIDTSNGEKLERWGSYYLLRPDPQIIWENDVITPLAEKNEIGAYKHYDFWQCMDTLRDKNYLEELITNNNTPWL